MSVHVVIPARMGSVRLPGKPLVSIGGVPMIVRVAQQASKASVDSVIVAVDDDRVRRVVEEAGFNAVLTARDHPSGSDRVMQVAAEQAWPDDDIVINVQGDEPLLPPAIIEQLASAMTADVGIDIATLSEPIGSTADFLDPNVVKLVTDGAGMALYFSRAPIPFPRDAMLVSDDTIPAATAMSDTAWSAAAARRHVGVYGFRVAALQRFVALKNSTLEHTERLEQLRWLEAGGRIQVLASVQPIPGGVDTPADVSRVEQLLQDNDAQDNSEPV